MGGKAALSREGRGQTLVPVATTAGESGRFNRDPSLFLLTDLSLCLYFMSHAPSGAVVLQPEPAPQSPPGGLVTAQISGPEASASARQNICFSNEFPACVMLPPDTTLLRAAPLESEVHSAARTKYIFVRRTSNLVPSEKMNQRMKENEQKRGGMVKTEKGKKPGPGACSELRSPPAARLVGSRAPAAFVTSQPRLPGEWLPWRRKPKARPRGDESRCAEASERARSCAARECALDPGWGRAGSGRSACGAGPRGVGGGHFGRPSKPPLQRSPPSLPVLYWPYHIPSHLGTLLASRPGHPCRRPDGPDGGVGGPRPARVHGSVRGGCSRNVAGRVQVLESRNLGLESQPGPFLAVCLRTACRFASASAKCKLVQYTLKKRHGGARRLRSHESVPHPVLMELTF